MIEAFLVKGLTASQASRLTSVHPCATDAAHIVVMTEVKVMQDVHVSFRANSAVVAELALRANRAGCSVSEYLRAMVREKVGLQ